MDQTHIRVEDLSVRFGKAEVLKRISLDIPDSRITAVIGPSGCGKTTLLRCMNRLIDLGDAAVSGRILVDGEDILSPEAEVTRLRKKMGYLAQRPCPLPMSIYDNIAYGPRLHGLRGKARLDETVERYLRLANLWDEVKDRLRDAPGKLSIGQQQRLCLARGLAVEPEIILADEPTSALDPVSSKHVESNLVELKDRYTIVVVTHILRQAKRLADHVVFLYMGELIESGPAAQIFENPQESLTRQYIQGSIS